MISGTANAAGEWVNRRFASGGLSVGAISRRRTSRRRTSGTAFLGERRNSHDEALLLLLLLRNGTCAAAAADGLGTAHRRGSRALRIKLSKESSIFLIVRYAFILSNPFMLK